MRNPGPFEIRLRVISYVSLLLAAVSLAPFSILRAQQAGNGAVTVTGLSTHESSNATLVSISADGPLSRAQTWKDSEGYHVVLPAAVAQDNIRAGQGIRLRQLGSSLEIILETKPGTDVTVRPL